MTINACADIFETFKSLSSQATIEALERLLNVVDDSEEISSLPLAFQRQLKLIERERFYHPKPSKEEKSGYVMLRKVVITPSRVIPHAREMIMGNAALRCIADYN